MYGISSRDQKLKENSGYNYDDLFCNVKIINRCVEGIQSFDDNVYKYVYLNRLHEEERSLATSVSNSFKYRLSKIIKGEIDEPINSLSELFGHEKNKIAAVAYRIDALVDVRIKKLIELQIIKGDTPRNIY